MKKLKYYIQRDFTKITGQNLSQIKHIWAKDLKNIPKNSKILSVYRRLVQAKKISPKPNLEKILQIRQSRSLSGLTPLAVMTEPFPCPGRCIFCPLEQGMPKSYLSDEPAAQRAKKLNFDPTLQIKSRLKQLIATGHPIDKIEVIVIGGTFSAYPQNYKIKFFKAIFDTLNNQTSQTLTEAQQKNQTAHHRIVALSVETRPDWVSEDEIKLLRKLGVTKIQLGVQSIDNKILKQIRRDHTVKAVVDATRALKNAGFKICYHFMPNLPGSTPKKDLFMAKKIFQDPRFMPDYLKIYPTQVITATKLSDLFKAGEFKTYSNQTLIKLLINIKQVVPPWTRLDRLVRDISKKWVSSGTYHTNLRQIIHQQMAQKHRTCHCIRCRQATTYFPNRRIVFKKTFLKTNGGQEYFLELIQAGKLLSLLRLRLPQRNEKILFPELKNAAIIRELHTFGVALPLGKSTFSLPQHRGLGRRLMVSAEKISRRHGYNKLAVIAAIGSKNYYQKFGFSPEGLYMAKNI